METRQYNSPRGVVTTYLMSARTGLPVPILNPDFPLIVGEDGIEPEWVAGTMSDDSEYFTVGATAEAWAAFDAKYPNQDAQTGSPYRFRNPRKSVSAVSFRG